MKLTGKLIIKGKINTETGLHIGGSKSSLDIGGVDLNVIKSPQGVPFIPGSSLKGKLRSLLAKTEGSTAVNARDAKGSKSDEDFPYLLQIFGSSGDDKDRGEVTRLLVRDAKLNEDHFGSAFDKDKVEMDFPYSDVKWENTINRKKGTAEHPRQLERVPAGAAFEFEMVYDLYEDAESRPYLNKDKQPEKIGADNISELNKHLKALETAMRLLQDDYLGGQGSRGYGKVKFSKISVEQKNITADWVYQKVDLQADVAVFAENLNNL
ncbi:MAG: type III-A CRISPR-associated RAMP protein Csm3 [Bacteroidota bacterium]